MAASSRAAPHMGLMTGWCPSPPARGGRGGVLVITVNEHSTLSAPRAPLSSGTRYWLIVIRTAPRGWPGGRTPASIEGCNRVRADLMEQQFFPDPGNGGNFPASDLTRRPLFTPRISCSGFWPRTRRAAISRTCSSRPASGLLACHRGIGALPRLCFKFVSPPLLTCRLS